MLHTARQPFPNRDEHARLAAISEQIDAAGARPTVPAAPQMVQPPSYGGPQRDAINSLVDGVVRDVCETIDALTKQLDALKSQVLVSADTAKRTLHEQVEVCARVRDEAENIREIIDEVAQKVLRI